MTTELGSKPWAGKIYVDGQFREAEGAAVATVLDKGRNEELAQAGIASPKDLEGAVASARKAQPEWAAQGYDVRAGLLRKVAGLIEQRADEIADLLIRETGCIRGKAEYEVGASMNECWEAAALTSRATAEVIPSHNTGKLSLIQRIPVGVVGAITPWNVPLYLNIAETVPALMAGNTVVLKPAQLTPWSGSELGRIIAEHTDIPPGVFNVVISNANEVGAALSADPRVDMITFTGSTATGRKILAAAAPTVKKTLLELGGKSAHIVLDDADFNSALPMAAMIACVMSGQSCILPSRILLPRSRYDEGIEILKTSMENFPIGDPWTPGVMQGPQISEQQRQKVLGLIRSGIDSGARLITGGGIPENLPIGYYTQPTLLADVDPNSQVAQEEIFGPVLTVTPYDTEDEAVAIANNTIYGLSGEVSSADVDRAFRVATRMRTGNVTINGRSHFGINSPFGGTKQSGLGYRNGDEGYKEYLEIKTIGMPE